MYVRTFNRYPRTLPPKKEVKYRSVNMVKHTRVQMTSKELLATSSTAIEEEDLFGLYDVGAKLAMQKAYLTRDISKMQRELAEIAAADKEVTATIKYQEGMVRIASKYRFAGFGTSGRGQSQ